MKLKAIFILNFLFCLIISVNAQEIDTVKICKKIIDNKINYKFFSALSRIKFSDTKKEIEADANILIRTDSAIWISVTGPLNIEGARILLTPDSVKLLNKLETTYSSFDYAALKNVFGVEINYFHIQALFFNNLFIYPASDFKQEYLKACKISKDNQLIEIAKGDTTKMVDSLAFFSKYSLGEKSFLPTLISILDWKGKRSIKVNYLEAIKFAKVTYPAGIDILAKTPRKTVSVSLTFKKVVVNEQKNMPFNVSAKYKKVDLFKRKN